MNEIQLSKKINELNIKIERLNTKIEVKKPWYKEAATIVASLALIFSFGTTLVSYQKAKEQDYIASRVELRNVMERLADLPLRHNEMLEKFKNNPNIASQMSGQMNAENLSLSNQADAIITRIENTRIGNGKILDIEFLAVANALSSSFQHNKAKLLIEKGLERSRDATTAAGALRSLANISLYFNDVNAARSYMEKARNIYKDSKYKSDAIINKNVTNTTTEIQWANMELILTNCVEVKGHLKEARNLILGIPSSPLKDQLVLQYNEIEARLEKCN